MIDPEQQARMDQAAAFVAEQMPALWKRMYDNLISVGFNENQAMEILKTYVFAAGNGRYQC